MSRQLAYGTVRDHPRKVIHVLRVRTALLHAAVRWSPLQLD
jgi:hypothetical protein